MYIFCSDIHITDYMTPCNFFSFPFDLFDNFRQVLRHLLEKSKKETLKTMFYIAELKILGFLTT